MYYTFWILRDKLTPTYDLWESAARFGLDDVEQTCRDSASEQINKVIVEGEGLQYFLRSGVCPELLTSLIRELYCGPRSKAADIMVLAQMRAAQS
jgi:hypothetical protein